ncbi:sucrose nonfermenting 4-like protein [Typha angustifolia]|uniref:sucrose nonfermenting 4-like protein n=1 Tax=Typha angustifolia TaxID=59011 RepID=UPI003C2CB224
MVLTRFSWPYYGLHISVCGSFTGFQSLSNGTGRELVGGVIFDLPPGVYQYRFLVDGISRCDEWKPCLANKFGVVNNVIVVEELSTAVVHLEPYTFRGMNLDEGIPLSTMPPEPLHQNSDAHIQVFRHWVCALLSQITIFDIIPVSSKVSPMDVQLPVKQAFRIMYEEGLAVVPLWDDSRGNLAGMLTASDFIFILRELQKNIQALANEELEMHSVSDWKEGKLQLYNGPDGAMGRHRRPLIHVGDTDSLKYVALKIVQNNISSVPILNYSLQNAVSMPLLNLATLPTILKFICTNIGEHIEQFSLLQYQICSIPLGTWLSNTGTGTRHQLAILRRDAPLISALNLLIEARVSSIPIVDDNGSLLDVYSRSDIIALAEDIYAHIQLEQMTVEHALEQVYRVNGRRRCPTCFRLTPFHEILEQLTHPGVRQLVVVDARTRFVEGIISLRDVFTFLLG